MADKPVRCAIYTRKSSDEGLDQSFNSLDAQREACAAYVLSQRHEGWVLNPEFYDDGGFSGGNMERPGLKALLADVQAGHIDVIVVYKVDRLTRSLADFAKMVEVFDATKVSFVSITQAFNTTTSMGRLTLNVLLSFAQFEREVTGERIRDKIAASKKKGMWMGGVIPLGYDVNDRNLVVNDAEARTVLHIFKRYSEIRSVRDLAQEMGKAGYRTKTLKLSSGEVRGGTPFGVGGLYSILSNPIYIGKIRHKNEVHQGLHDPIIAAEDWEQVQRLLADGTPTRGDGTSKRQEHLLSGIVEDEHGRHMYVAHATKRSVRYRYYLTHPRRMTKGGPRAIRVPAHDLEQLVLGQLVAFFADENALLQSICNADATAFQELLSRAGDAVTLLKGEQLSARRALEEWCVKVIVAKGGFDVSLKITARVSHTLSAKFEKVRRGVDVKLQIASPDAPPERDEKLVALFAEAYAARKRALADPELELDVLAAEQGIGLRRYKKLIKLSYTSPDIVNGILDGSLAGSEFSIM